MRFDVCLIDRIDDVIARVGEPDRRRIAGLQRTIRLFFPCTGKRAKTNGGEFSPPPISTNPPWVLNYSGDRDGAMGRAPVYLNYGFVALSRAAFEAIAPLQASYCSLCRRLIKDSFFLTQVALSLVAVATESEVELLTYAYNSSNDDLPFRAPDQFRIGGVGEIRVIHYLRGDQFDRRTFLVDPAAYAAFMSADNLNLVNRRLRDHVATLARDDDLLFR